MTNQQFHPAIQKYLKTFYKFSVLVYFDISQNTSKDKCKVSFQEKPKKIRSPFNIHILCTYLHVCTLYIKL